jgi:hypothetical protein
VLLTAASWILQRLPGLVVEHQRGKAIRSLSEARDLVVEVAVGPVPSRSRPRCNHRAMGSRTLVTLWPFAFSKSLRQVRALRADREYGRETLA